MFDTTNETLRLDELNIRFEKHLKMNNCAAEY